MRLSIAVINKINKHKCNGTEIDLLIHIAQYQQANGEVPNVHYKEFMDSFGKYACEYYNALKSLENKGIISVERTDKAAYRTITIKDNNFESEGSYENNRYVNMHLKLWHTEEFKNLTASAKRFILALVLDTNGRRIPLSLTKAKIAERANLKGTDKRTAYAILQAVQELKIDGEKVFEVVEIDPTKNKMRQFSFRMINNETRTTSAVVPNKKKKGGLKVAQINTEENVLKTYAYKMYLKKHRLPVVQEDLDNLLVMDYSFSKLGRMCQALWANKLKELFVQYKKQIKQEGNITSVCRIVQDYMRDISKRMSMGLNYEKPVSCPLV